MEDWLGSMARSIMLSLFYDGEEKQEQWNELNKKDKATVMSLPNFDADIFYECTGIRVDVPDKSCEVKRSNRAKKRKNRMVEAFNRAKKMRNRAKSCEVVRSSAK